MTPEQRIEYIRTVWGNFTQRRGVPGNAMSSADFSIISAWAHQDIPLPVILRGIQDCAGEMTSRTPLSYIVPAVNDAIAYHRKAMA